MNDNDKTVLACVDGSKFGHAVCDYAAWIAQRVGRPLKLLHTIDHHHETAKAADLSGNIGLDSREHLLEEITAQEQQESKLRLQQGKTLLALAKERVMAAGIAEPAVCLQHGSLIDALGELEAKIRVLVVGARGKIHENSADQIGAKIAPLIRSLHCPILVAYDAFKAPERIMIAYDGSEAADKAVDMVADSPLYKGLVCHLVHVGSKTSADPLLDRAEAKLRAAGGIDIVSACLEGKAERMLCEYQSTQDIDMTVMGAFSHSRLHDFVLGSFTHKMLLKTQKPLLLLR
ncbi:MAG: universal stress protein [Gammaproteobacteria bacterium]